MWQLTPPGNSSESTIGHAYYICRSIRPANRSGAASNNSVRMTITMYDVWLLGDRRTLEFDFRPTILNVLQSKSATSEYQQLPSLLPRQLGNHRHSRTVNADPQPFQLEDSHRRDSDIRWCLSTFAIAVDGCDGSRHAPSLWYALNSHILSRAASRQRIFCCTPHCKIL